MFTRTLGAAVAAAMAALASGAAAQPLAGDCAEALGARPITIVVPSRAGGGYDTYARAFAPALEETAGRPVSVVNVTAGGGMMAIAQVAGQSPDEILIHIDGAADVINSTDGPGMLDFGSDALEILGILYSEPEAWIAPAGTELEDPGLSHLVFSTASLESNFLAMVVASQALGFTLDIVPGYGGSTEGIAAVMRGEVDLTTSSLTSALRGARSADLEVVLVLSEAPHPAAPGVRTLLGADGLFDIRNAGLDEDTRRARRDMARAVVELGTTHRALFTASTVAAPVLDCLRDATDAALALPSLAERLSEQGRPLEPVPSAQAQKVYAAARAAFAENSGMLARIFAEFDQ